MAEFLVCAGFVFVLFALMAATSDALADDEEDDDLAWVEREIARGEDGWLGEAETNPDMRRQRREHLDRLYRIRERLRGL